MDNKNNFDHPNDQIEVLKLGNKLKSNNISLEIIKECNLKYINNTIEYDVGHDVGHYIGYDIDTILNINDIGLTPLCLLCANINISAEMLKFVKENSNADFDKYVMLKNKNKKYYISALTYLCQNANFSESMFEFVSDQSFAPKDLIKHKKHSPIFSLCANKNVTITMLKIINESGNELFQKSPIIENTTSFDLLFSNESIDLNIVKYIFDNYELQILFNKSAIIKLLSNPKINFKILSYLCDNYQRIVLDNFIIILMNPKIIQLNLKSMS